MAWVKYRTVIVRKPPACVTSFSPCPYSFPPRPLPKRRRSRLRQFRATTSFWRSPRRTVARTSIPGTAAIASAARGSSASSLRRIAPIAAGPISAPSSRAASAVRAVARAWSVTARSIRPGNKPLGPHSCACHRNPASPSPWAERTPLRRADAVDWIPVTSTGMRAVGSSPPGLLISPAPPRLPHAATIRTGPPASPVSRDSRLP